MEVRDILLSGAVLAMATFMGIDAVSSAPPASTIHYVDVDRVLVSARLEFEAQSDDETVVMLGTAKFVDHVKTAVRQAGESRGGVAVFRKSQLLHPDGVDLTSEVLSHALELDRGSGTQEASARQLLHAIGQPERTAMR